MATGLEARPLPYFLALTLATLGVLWGTIATVVWASARNERRLHEQNWRRELERNADLRRERDEARERLDRERSENMRLTMEVVGTAHGLARLREDLDRQALELADKKAERAAQRAARSKAGAGG